MINESATTNSSHRPVLTSFVGTFLKPEMWHVFNQVRGLRQFESKVITRERLNADRFPMESVWEVPTKLRPWWSWERAMGKWVRGELPIIYRGQLEGTRSLLEELKTDLVHVYFGHEATRLAPLFSQRLWTSPWVVSFHGADLGRYVVRPRDAEQLPAVFESCSIVLARCDYFRPILESLGCPPNKIRINRTHVPTEHFPAIVRPPPDQGRWHWLQAGRMIPKKGFSTTLRAFAEFRRAYPQARLTLAGDGPQRQELEEQVRREGWAEAVSFPGFIGRQELADLMRDAHFFLHPSETDSQRDIEGVPNSLLEAMATGLVCAATRHAGIPEVVQDGISGILAEEGDADTLSDRLVALAEDPDAYAAIGQKAASFVRQELSPDRQIALLESAYHEALRGVANRTGQTARHPIEASL
jgi:colanic acid/amylovoran biosynthesis glycosyltransferase